MAKLLTNPEDPYHVHAICGLMALLHYIYRFRLMGLGIPQAGYGQSLPMDVLSLLILALPNLTSFIFRSLRAKKGNDSYSIWREYRGHASVYSAKTLFYMALLIYARHFQNGYLHYDSFYRHALEFVTMFGMQAVTQQYDPKHVSSGTIRGFYSDSHWMIFMAGFLQFLARACLFCGPPHPTNHNMLAAFTVGMFVIQMNAFNMTLRKKRIMGPKTTAFFYGILLAGASYQLATMRIKRQPPKGMFDPMFKPIYLAILAYAGRRNGLDRFSCWIVALSIMSIATPQFGLFLRPPASTM